jgi:protein phosphatase
LRPKNNEDCPSPRAAHASTGVEANQLVIFGGAHSHGNLVDNELYLLKLSNSEANGKWVKVPVKGEKPSSRYGHSMVFFKPFILVISGNILNEPCDEVWYLSIDKSPFYWKKIEFNYPG